MSVGIDIGDTLAQVNLVREAMGADPLYELPNSRTGATQSCLFYRALSDVGCTSVGGTTVSFTNERQAELVAELWGVSRQGNEVSAPGQMKRTIARFDRNHLKHYETLED